MLPVKYLCELDISNHLQPGESIEDWYERLTKDTIEIAKNLNTSPETFAILVKDSNWRVRYQVAQNHNTPQETLALLAGDSNDEVKIETKKKLIKRNKV